MDERKTAEEKATEERMAGDKMTEERMAEEKAIEERMAGDKMTEKTITEETSSCERRFYSEDYITAAVLLAAAWIYARGWELLGGLCLPLFTAFFAAAGIYRFQAAAKRTGGLKSMTKEGRIGLIFLAAGGLWFLIKYIPGLEHWERQGIMPYMVLFLHFMGVYWLLTIGGARRYGRLDENAVVDLIRGFFVIPLVHFDAPFVMVFSAVKRLRKKKRLEDEREKAVFWQGAAGLLVSIPILLFLIPMLKAADESFEKFTESFAGWCSRLTASCFHFSAGQIMWNLLTLLLACYFAALFYGTFCEKVTIEGGKEKQGSGTADTKEWQIPAPFLFTFSGSVCGLYFVFFLVKTVDIIRKASAGPGSFVYSEYARQGFFELSFIAVINFLLFCFMKGFMPKASRHFQRILSLLAVQTLALIGLAFAKMLLYIGAYGFTFLRVFTSWFMIVLFVTFFRLLLYVRKNGNAVGPAIVFGAVTFLLLAYSNMDVWMVWGNRMMGLG